MNDMLDLFNTLFGPEAEAEGAFIDGDRLSARYSNEVSLRRGLAQIAYAYGWTVQEELVIPGWGRIDIVLRDPGDGVPYLIELKLDLTKPAKVRRAFQQADGYGRWWVTNRGEQCRTFLVAAKDDLTVVRQVHGTYPEVGYLSAGQMVAALGTWGNGASRARVAQGRINDLRKQIALHEVAIGHLQEATNTEENTMRNYPQPDGTDPTEGQKSKR